LADRGGRWGALPQGLPRPGVHSRSVGFPLFGGNDGPVACQSCRGYVSFAASLLYRAARLVDVLTVAEAALLDEGPELSEAVGDLLRREVAQAERAYAGRIDQFAAVRQVIQRGFRSRMPPQTAGMRELADANFPIRQ